MAAGLLAAFPVYAQAPDAKAAQNAINWGVLQKLYPARAIAAHEEGAVGFIVSIDSKGDVTNCEVTRSSGHPLLDAETCKIITLHAVFNPDSGLGASQTRTHEGMITWKLPASTTVLAQPAPIVITAASPDKVICKRIVRAGTLADFERTCMTPTDWQRQRDEMLEPFIELQGKGATHGG